MLQLNNIYQQIVRYKGHHIFFWAVYHFIWWSIYEGNVFSILHTITLPHLLVKFLGYVIVQAFGVYFCLYFLVPNYLEKRKYFTFLLTLLGVVFLMCLIITSNYYLALAIADDTHYEGFRNYIDSPLKLFKANVLPSCVAAITLGLSIKLSKNWLEVQKKQQALQKEKLETELRFLKSQFNPHFLFNTINSIFVLINKNTEMASESLVKFSNLLRYQLYECNSDLISLKNELLYIKSFIELESLRQNNDFKLEESYPEHTNNLLIAPFVLIPFIENAFKHVTEDEYQNKWIQIQIQIKGKSLIFNVSNSSNYNLNGRLINDTVYKGLGLKNVKRRLDLLYTGNYELNVTKLKGSYSVNLKVNLEQQQQVNVESNKVVI
ncbi:sensor histidine kinase [Flavivirga algicola]|uniref:Histidine kinase n=1 Tax=Flavivirga algicola TaxID=2729136 RepID=A0ABX1S3W4_9FLAO|nr:histidine kinase [Flavivirga algicola]NMH89583.1 histidine kinase [Flavivirga algicola]